MFESAGLGNEENSIAGDLPVADIIVPGQAAWVA